MMSEEILFDEEIAPHYEAWYETPGGQRADALEKASLRQLLESFSNAQSVLEVGSGTAHFTRWLSEQGLVAVGMDLSAAMLAQARSLDGVPLVQGDALRLPFTDDAFEGPQEALAEARRVARYGMLLGVLNRWSLLGLQRRLAGIFRLTVYDVARFYGVGELKRLLQSTAGGKAHIVWHTTLFPCGWLWKQSTLPWGGFIGMALLTWEGQ
jgi:SAM-dependent methyltransferase